MNPSPGRRRLRLWLGGVLAASMASGAVDLPFYGVLTGGGDGYDVAKAVVVDRLGRRVVVGEFSGEASAVGVTGESDGPSDGFVLVLGSDDRATTGMAIGGPGRDAVLDVVVDASGNYVLVGTFEDEVDFGTTRLRSAGGRDGFVAKMTPSGEFLWARAIGGRDYDEAGSVGLDGAGQVLVAGSFVEEARYGMEPPLSTPGTDGTFLVKYDAGGGVVWGQAWSGPDAVVPLGLAASAEGTATVVGWFVREMNVGGTRLVAQSPEVPTGEATDGFVARVNAAGRLEWAVRLGGTGMDAAFGIAVDAAGNSYVGGGYVGSVDFGRFRLSGGSGPSGFVGQLSARGDWNWVQAATSPSPCWVGPVALDGAGNVYVAGMAQGPVQAFGVSLGQGANARLFVAKLSRVGQTLAAGMLSTRDSAEPEGLAVPAVDEFHLAGQFGNALELGTNVWESAGGGDGFLASGGIYSLPRVVVPPSAATLTSGGSLVLKAEAAGGGLRFEWLRDGEPLPGAREAVLEVPEIQSVQGGMYSVRVSNALGTTTSTAVPVRVNLPSTGFTPADLIHESVDASDYDGPFRSVHDGRGRVYLFSGTMNLVDGQAAGSPFRLRERDGSWDPGFNLGTRFENVTAMAVDAEGRVLVAGVEGNGTTILRLAPTGATDRSFTPLRWDRGVRFLVVQRDGRILVAATLPRITPSPATPIPRPAILRLNPDGTLDSGFQSIEFDDTLLTLRWPPWVDATGNIYLTPSPSTVRVGGVVVGAFGRARPDGSLDAAYRPLETYPGGLTSSASVRAFGFQSDGRVVVVGSFMPVGVFDPNARKAALRFTTDGSVDPTFAEPNFSLLGGSAGVPRAMVVLPDDSFAMVGTRLAFVPRDGQLEAGGVVFEVETASSWMSATADGRVLLPGTGTAEGTWVGGPTMWTKQGRDPTFVAPRFGTRVQAESLAVLADGRLAVAGGFNRVDGVFRPGVALLRLDDGQATAGQVDWGLGNLDWFFGGGTPVQVAEGPGGTAYVHQQLLNTTPDLDTSVLVRIQADGRQDPAFRPNQVPYWMREEPLLHGQGDGRLILAFEGSGAAAVRGRFAVRLDREGVVDPTFVGELPEAVERFAVVTRDASRNLEEITAGGVRMIGNTPEGGLLVAATTVDGVTRILRWDRDGRRDAGFAGPALPGAQVTLTSVEVLDPLFDVGQYVTVKGFRANSVAEALVLPDERILLAGWFREIAGVPLRGLARLLPDGRLDPTFRVEDGPSLAGEAGQASVVTGLALDSGGRLYLAGMFDHVGALAASGLARLLPDGTPDATFAPPLRFVGSSLVPSRLRLLGNRLLVLGGYASMTNPYPRSLWSLPVTGNGPSLLEQPLGGLARMGETVELRARAVGEAPLNYQWRKDGVPIPGATLPALKWQVRSPSDAGQFTVVVSDSQGSRVSVPARIGVPGRLRLSVQAALVPGAVVDVRAEDADGAAWTTERARGVSFERSDDLRTWTQTFLAPMGVDQGRGYWRWVQTEPGRAVFLRATER